ncbi:MAG: hypothetical protein ABFS56_29585 [Pseudomonadota bacterium]
MENSEPKMIHPDVLTPEEIAYARKPEVIRQDIANAEKFHQLRIEDYRKCLQSEGISEIDIRNELLEVFPELAEEKFSLSETANSPEMLEAEKRGWKKAILELFMEGTIGIDILKKKLGIQTNGEAMKEIKKVSPNFHLPAIS